MSKKSALPDAWDNDWESLADKPEPPVQQVAPEPFKLSKAERKAKHIQEQRKLWDAAESPEQFHFLDTRSEPPLKTGYQPTVQLLSRKPAPKIASRRDLTSGMTGMTLEDDEDSEEERRKQVEMSLAERQRKAQQEREEKQRKYNEVRERLFGSSTSTPTTSQGDVSTSSGAMKAEPRARNARGKWRGVSSRDNQPNSSTDQSPARAEPQEGQLFNPRSNNFRIKARESAESGSRPATPSLEQPIRAPRGPNGGGKNGFGFAQRGGRGTV
ncbi:hypothetical protein B0A49_02913 [Cryomyces minteri]|uniref:Uncharacterized protein n=1 Tax=Cryomyces minteri TaxID=331657 RepID=A0A4V5NID1_9PEZI|nr:hypothetical protein B0A49_02913 [Cryomyces minteri]